MSETDQNILKGMAAERASLQKGTPMWGEHRARYHFAAPLVKGKTVLDIACGTGFGAKMLVQQGAATVVGIDYSEEALKLTKACGTADIDVVRADGTKLPFDDGSIDAVTSFETVEHIPDHKTFVKEIRRVLSPDGIAIMSTPNALYTQPVNGVPANPFHIYEFTPGEFQELLEDHFSSVRMYGQRVAPEYRICPYWEKPGMLPTDPVSRMKIVAWKLQARLPGMFRDRLSQLTTGRSFFPDEHDFVFSEAELMTGYVQVAVCIP